MRDAIAEAIHDVICGCGMLDDDDPAYGQANAVLGLLAEQPLVEVIGFDDGDGSFVYGKNFRHEDAVEPGRYALVRLP